MSERVWEEGARLGTPGTMSRIVPIRHRNLARFLEMEEFRFFVGEATT